MLKSLKKKVEPRSGRFCRNAAVCATGLIVGGSLVLLLLKQKRLI